MNDSTQAPILNPFLARLANSPATGGLTPAQASAQSPPLPAKAQPEPIPAPPEPILVSPAGAIELRSVEQVFRLGKLLWDSRLLPTSFKSPQQVCVCLLRALELKLPPLQALEGMSVVNGRVGLMGDLALSLVESSGLLADRKVRYSGEGDSLKCTLTVQRKGREAQAYCFSVAEAKSAGIYDRSQTWKSYPRRMVYYRALGFALRDEFSDVLRGIKTTEELLDYSDTPAPSPNANQTQEISQ